MKRWGLVLIVLMAVLVTGTALAHERIVSGDYALTRAGWTSQPSWG